MRGEIHRVRADGITPRIFFGTVALVFVISAAVTILWCASMADMPGMPMPGGWTMSMAWMRMPNQTWLEASASFIGMWSVMMVAMMLPAITPTLWRLTQCNRLRHREGGVLVTAGGYFSVWVVVGMIIYVVGIIWAELTMQFSILARAVPFLNGCIVFAAGVFQFTGLKSRWLACCRTWPQHVYREPANLEATWMHGARFGADCVGACSGFTALLLVFGMMDLTAMTVITLAIAVERFTRIEKYLGWGICFAGSFFILNTLI